MRPRGEGRNLADNAILRTDDRGIVRKLDRECFPYDEPEDLNDAILWVSYDAKGPTGFSIVKQPYTNAAFHARVGVAPRARGQGLQKRFIRTACAWARREGLEMLYTYTAPGNAASNNSYISCGFRTYYGSDGWVHWSKKLCTA